MVSSLDSESSGPILKDEAWPGALCGFPVMGKTLYSSGVFFHPGV